MHLERDEFTVTYNPAKSTPNAIIQTIIETGYTARIVTAKSLSQDQIPASPNPSDVEPLATALREARESRKPILLAFHADWCAPCKRMENETFSDKRVVAMLEQYVVLKVNTDEHIELSESLGVVGLPDIRLVSSDGQRQVQLQGFQSVDSLVPELKTFLGLSKP